MLLRASFKLPLDITSPLAITICIIVIGTSFRSTDSLESAHNPETLCRNEMTGCGSCLKAHRDCGWCSDPSFNGEFRCDVSDYLRESCPKHLVHQEESKLEVVQDNPLGSPNPYNALPLQMQPQHLQMTMRPGATMSFELKYVHRDKSIDQIYLLNSDVETQGLTLTLTSNCPESQKSSADPRSCFNMKPNDILVYNISLTLTDCITSGDAVVSVGVGGLREVVAVYVTPSCGCDCEKYELHEQHSSICNQHGTLICGKCMCDTNRQGKQCEFDAISTTLVETTAVTDDCRFNNSYPDCSGHGSCVFGRCECHRTAEAQYYGRYCECNDESCPKIDGRMCSGNGRCQCGRCFCDSGWTEHDCRCSSSEENCRSSNGEICNGAGTCRCNKCHCHESTDSHHNPLTNRCESTGSAPSPKEEEEEGRAKEEEGEKSDTPSTLLATTTTTEEKSPQPTSIMLKATTTTETKQPPMATTNSEDRDDHHHHQAPIPKLTSTLEITQPSTATSTMEEKEMETKMAPGVTTMSEKAGEEKDTPSTIINNSMDEGSPAVIKNNVVDNNDVQQPDIQSPLGGDASQEANKKGKEEQQHLSSDKSTVTEKKSQTAPKPGSGAAIRHHFSIISYFSVFAILCLTFVMFC